MAMNINSAISAYQTAAKAVTEGSAGPAQQADPGGSFATLLKDGLNEAVAVSRHSEEMSLKGISGEADMRDVVLAVANAEQALNTVVAVRDKVVNAYQEILKMPI